MKSIARLLPIAILAGCANNTVSLWAENDAFALGPIGDANYTNGIAIVIDPEQERKPCEAGCNDLFDSFTAKVNMLGAEENTKPKNKAKYSERFDDVNIRYGLAQQIFTPDNLSRRELIEDDRPYAGWLFGSVDISNDRRDANSDGIADRDYRQRNIVGLRLGVVGPLSGAKAVQRYWHQYGCNCTIPLGWRNQLRNEPGFVYSLTHERRLFRRPIGGKVTVDGIGLAKMSVGNVFTGPEVGATLRIGFNQPQEWADWSSGTIEAMSPVGRDEKGRGFFGSLFVAATGRYVVRDIFLDGNTFRDSHSVDKEKYVSDQMFGLEFGYDRWSARMTYVRRSIQHEFQPDPHRIGSLVITRRVD